MIGPYVSLSAGMAPGQEMVTDPVVRIGDRTMIGRGSHVVGHFSIDIGDDIQTGPYVYITDQNHVYEDPDMPIGLQWPKEASVSVGSGTWLGTGVVVLPGAQIGRNVVVGAGSVVIGELPDHCVAVGSPARVVKRYVDGRGLGARRLDRRDGSGPTRSSAPVPSDGDEQRVRPVRWRWSEAVSSSRTWRRSTRSCLRVARRKWPSSRPPPPSKAPSAFPIGSTSPTVTTTSSASRPWTSPSSTAMTPTLLTWPHSCATSGSSICRVVTPTTWRPRCGRRWCGTRCSSSGMPEPPWRDARPEPWHSRRVRPRACALHRRRAGLPATARRCRRRRHRPSDVGAGIANGLGVVDTLAVIPHYDQMKRWMPEADEFWATWKPAGARLIGIDEDTAIVPSAAGWEVHGPPRGVGARRRAAPTFRSGRDRAFVT